MRNYYSVKESSQILVRIVTYIPVLFPAWYSAALDCVKLLTPQCILVVTNNPFRQDVVQL